MSQISKVLIGYDGSQCSDAALHDLRRAGLPAAINATVLTLADVIVPPRDDVLPDEPAIRIPEVERRAKAHAQKAINQAQSFVDVVGQRLSAAFPSWNVRTLVDADAPAWALIKMAAELETDLIVVGSHGHSSVGGRLILGSVSQRVLHEAGCSVRVARCSEDHREGPIRIIVGFDGSESSQEAVRAVAARAWPKGTEVRVVTARGISKPELFVEVMNDFRAVGLSVSETNSAGDPVHALINEAVEWNADSIFVGTRDLHGFRHLLHGSVSSAVAAQAMCSVEVVRPSRLKQTKRGIDTNGG